MACRALVVDDDPEIQEAVGDVLRSLGHQYDVAACQEEARRLLAANRYSYYLLDLEIPVLADRGFARIQNGENLLREIVADRGDRFEPIIVMTGHGTTGPELAVRMMKLGADDYVTKPFTSVGNTLDRAILEALAGRKQGGRRPVKDCSSRAPARFEGGELVFHRKRVELCGITVVEGRTRMRRVLEELRTKRPSGKYVALSGMKLAARLGVTAGENGIAEAVKDFRDTVVDRLEAEGIVCGRRDVILSGGAGYRLAEWIVVRDGADVEGGLG